MWKEFQDELNSEETLTKRHIFFFYNSYAGVFPFQTIFTKPWAKKISIFPSSPIYSAKNLKSTALVDILHHTEQDSIALYNQVFYILVILTKLNIFNNLQTFFGSKMCPRLFSDQNLTPKQCIKPFCLQAYCTFFQSQTLLLLV